MLWLVRFYFSPDLGSSHILDSNRVKFVKYIASSGMTAYLALVVTMYILIPTIDFILIRAMGNPEQID